MPLTHQNSVRLLVCLLNLGAFIMKNFRSLQLAIKQHKMIKSLKLKGELRSQTERAALSVCLNLTEGNARITKKERRRFFNTSCPEGIKS